MTATHVVSNGRRYGRPFSQNTSRRHAASRAGRDRYRTLCGRSWHTDDMEVGGDIGTDLSLVTCRQCRTKLKEIPT